jgi:hypothetical protein
MVGSIFNCCNQTSDVNGNHCFKPGSCSDKTFGEVTKFAAITSLVATILATLVFVGILQVGSGGVMMGTNAAFWSIVGGGALFVISGALLTVRASCQARINATVVDHAD